MFLLLNNIQSLNSHKAYYATQLRNKDLDVVKIGGAYLSVKATEEQVKSALISQKRAESEAAWKRQS